VALITHPILTTESSVFRLSPVLAWYVTVDIFTFTFIDFTFIATQ